MLHHRYPAGAWNWAGSALIAGLALMPLFATLLLAPSARNWAMAGTISQLTVSPLIVVAAVVVYFQYRLTEDRAVGWITICLAVYGVENVTLAGIRAVEEGANFRRPAWVMLVDVCLALAVLGVARWGDRLPTRLDPLAIGLVAGIAVAAVQLQFNANAPVLNLDIPPIVLALVVCSAWLGACIIGVRACDLPAWMSVRLAAGSALLAVNHVASCWPSEIAAYNLVVIGTGVLAAMMLLGPALAGLRFTIREQAGWLHDLRDRVDVMEAYEREHRARLHEITNTVAGIASASSLIHHEEMPSGRRHLLEEMLEHEAARLARILAQGAHRSGASDERSPRDPHAVADLSRRPRWSERGTPDRSRVVDLDEVIRPLVVAQQAIGRTVDWEPSGERVRSDPDAVAEALNILLDNARKHAPGATTTVSVTRRADQVQVLVADDGPGIAPEVSSRLFDWGGRGPRSGGQGLGLHLARERLSCSGSTLRQVHSTRGAAFVACLPAADLEVS